MGTDIAPAAQEIIRYVNDHKQEVLDALPQGVNGQLIVRQFQDAVRSDVNIAACTMESIVGCLRKSVIYGLEVGVGRDASITSQAYMIPYGKEAKFQISYKGIKELVRRSGKGTLVADVAVEGEEFVDNGKYQLPTHKPAKGVSRRQGEVTHSYAAFLPNDGGAPIVAVWTREECIKHRDQHSKGYKGKKDSPWHIDNPGFPVMCMKTAIFELAHRGDLPMQTEAVEIMRQEVAPAMAAAPRVANQPQALPPATDEPPIEMPEEDILDSFADCTTIAEIQDTQEHLINNVCVEGQHQFIRQQATIAKQKIHAASESVELFERNADEATHP